MHLRSHPVWKGCRWIEYNGEELTPLRFFPERLRAYSACDVKPYARCPVGVRLDFTTCRPEISFHFRRVKQFLGAAAFDIYENMRMRETVVIAQDEGDVRYRRNEQEASRITVYFPSNAELWLSRLNLGEAIPVKEEKEPLMLVLGDSISQGLFAMHPSLSWVPIVARQKGWRVLNLSVGGDRFDADWLDAGVCEPQWIVVALGTNDFSFEQDDVLIDKMMKAYFCKLEEIYPGVPVWVITPPWVSGLSEKDKKRYEGLRQRIELEARSRGCSVIDGYTLIPPLADFFTDEAHPNDLGFSQYAINFLARFNKKGMEIV
jgi:hypothetical protein